MSVRLTIHGAWWIRAEDLDVSAKRVEETFGALGTFSCIWRNWYTHPETLDYPPESETLVTGDLDAIRRKLLSSVEQPDDEEMGYGLGVSSDPLGGTGWARSTFHLHCCSKTAYSGYNTLSIQLPTPENALALYERDVLSRIISALADTWDTDWLRVWDLKTALPAPWPPRPELGWVNYLPRRTAVLPDVLPTGWEWFAERGEKQIFIHTAGPPDASNPEHVAAFKRLDEAIKWGEPPEFYRNWKAGRRIESSP